MVTLKKTDCWWQWDKLKELARDGHTPTEHYVTSIEEDDFSLSDKQNSAVKEVLAWHANYKKTRKGPRVFRLFGYAGTGKTTMAKKIASSMQSVIFTAYTGKACMVLTSKGCRARTLHSLLYRPETDEDGKVASFGYNPTDELSLVDLIVVDEISMVGNDEGEHLLASCQTPILVLGDPFQLPPIHGTGFFVKDKPDIVLTEIHRNAADSPVLRLATMIRQGEKLKPGNYGDSIVADEPSTNLMEYDQIICGRNDTRKEINLNSRTALGYTKPVVRGEKLVVLKNSAFSPYSVNGSTWTVNKLRDKFEVLSWQNQQVVKDPILSVDARCTDVGEEDSPFEEAWLALDPLIYDKAYPWYLSRPRKGRQRTVYNNSEKIQFYESDLDYPLLHVDFGYALTGHKAQGSQWGSVAIINESYVFRKDCRRWLYTSVTRAVDSVSIFDDYKALP